MKLYSVALLLLFSALFSGCEDDAGKPALLIFTKDFDFNAENYEWSAGFADFPSNPADSTEFELKSAYTEPIESKLGKRSVMLSGKNVNKDLFMYIKKKVDDLKPDTDYTLTFNVELTSDRNGIQPAANASVLLKAGATQAEPKSVIEAGKYVMNIDKGNQASSGDDMISLGDIISTGTGAAYSLISRSNTMANSRYVARTNSNGELWLIVGTDSSLEGPAKVFYTRIQVVFSAS